MSMSGKSRTSSAWTIDDVPMKLDAKTLSTAVRSIAEPILGLADTSVALGASSTGITAGAGTASTAGFISSNRSTPRRLLMTTRSALYGTVSLRLLTTESPKFLTM